MIENGSPKPLFETDDDYNYFLAVLPIHPEFLSISEKPTETELRILLYCLKPQKRAAVLKKIGFSNHPKNYQRYIVPLIEKGWLIYTVPNVPTSPNQQYVTTEKGKQVLG